MNTPSANTLAKRRSRTNPAIKEAERVYRRNNRDKEYARLTSIRHTPKGWALNAIRQARHRAKQKELDCTLVVEDIIIPEYCPVLGMPIRINTGVQQGNSPSLDRVDNNKGYTKANVRVISHRANQLKRDATLEELRKLVAYIEKECVS